MSTTTERQGEPAGPRGELPAPARRQRELLDRLAEHNAEALLVSQGENRRYLSGFTGSTGWLFVAGERTALLTDGRYWTQLEAECPELEIIRYRAEDGSMGKVLAGWLQSIGWKGRLGFESRHLTVADHEALTRDLEPAGLRGLQAIAGLVEELRQVKDGGELEALKRAAAVADQAFAKALEVFEEGISESDFCVELEYQMRKFGARKPSFDSIVASGPNGAKPHAGATERRIKAGELVTVDFGVQLDGFMSDMTRTIWIGQLPELETKVYTTVRQAQQAALEALKPGLLTKDIDAVARDLIKAAGYGEAFSHGLGHGIGLAVHELPSLRSTTETELAPGMVVTIEPGIYLAGQTGCRVEDSAIVTATGREPITRTPKQELQHRHPREAF